MTDIYRVMTRCFTAISEMFSSSDYLFWSRVEGTLWTAADFVIVFLLLRIANLFRGWTNRRPHRIPYIFLALTLPPACLIPIAPNAQAFWRLELMVTIPHFLLILYVIGVNLRPGLAYLEELNKSTENEQQ